MFGATAGFGTPQSGTASAFGKPAGTQTGSAFSFGGLSSAAAAGSTPAPLFGAASKPAFGAASTPAFGASSTGMFGASSAGLFGSSLAPAASGPALGGTGAFGAAPAGTGMFGSSQPSAFGTSTSSLFGKPAVSTAPATGLFGAAAPVASSTPGFSFAAQSTGFATTSSTPGFSLALTPTSGGMFRPAATPGATPQQPFGTPGQQQPAALTYSTKWDDIPPNVQNELLELEKVVDSYRKDCDILEKEPRLKDSTALKKSIESELGSVRQAAQSMLATLRADEDTVADIHEKVNRLLRSAETAVRTYNRARLWREGTKGTSLPPAAVQELISMPVTLPSSYLEQCTAGFEEVVEDLKRSLTACEAVLPVPAHLLASLSQADEQGGDVAGSLQAILRQVHDFLMHLAARTAAVHEQVQRAKDEHLAQLRQQGDHSNPFQEERRRRTPPAAIKVVIPPAQPRPQGTGQPTAAAPGALGTGLPAGASSFGTNVPSLAGSSTPGFGTPQPGAQPSSPFASMAGAAFAPAAPGAAASAAAAQRTKSTSQRRRG